MTGKVVVCLYSIESSLTIFMLAAASLYVSGAAKVRLAFRPSKPFP